MKIIEPPFLGYVMETGNTLSCSANSLDVNFVEVWIRTNGFEPDMFKPLGSVMWLKGVLYDPVR